MSAQSVREVGSGERYTSLAIALHWLIAVLIVGMLLLGFYMVSIPKGIPNRAFYFNLHKSFGVLAGVLILLRLGWRLTHSAPQPQVDMAGWMNRATWWSHRLLYVCMLVQPATGYLASSFNKYGVKFFGVALPNWGWDDAPLRDLFVRCHDLTAIVFSVLIAIHVLAAFKHLLVDRDRVFQRMLPSLFGVKKI